MESALSPREIQTRIRSGESVDDVARVAGIDRDRVERFAAPVIAEREHVAGLAMMSSARRRGETSSHRTLRGVLNERLLNRGVDIGTVGWDSYRLDDGRWAVTADYLSGETPRQALFYFDVPGRFSVAGNDEGRGVLGDTSPSRGTQPGRRPPVVGETGGVTAGETGGDTEPTLDLSDELALVRAIQDIPSSSAGAEAGSEVEMTIAEVYQLNRTEDEAVEPEAVEPEAVEPEAVEPEAVEPEAVEPEAVEPEAVEEDEGGLGALFEIFDDQDPLPENAVDAPAEEPAEAEDRALGGSGPSDASAVPELSTPLQPDAWEPAIVVDYPIEPGDEDFDDVDGVEVPEGSDTPGRPEAPVGREDRRDEATALEDESRPVEPDEPLPLDIPEQPTPPPAPKPARRKRASVPSWDEIVFGGPKDK